MKNIFSPLSQLVAVAACALTLGSCNRAEYAMLPKGASYHGVTRVATPVPATETTSSLLPVAPQAVISAPSVATQPTQTPALAPKAEATAQTAAAPAQVEQTEKQAIAAASVANTAVQASKLNVVQRLALNKVARKMDKLMQKAPTARQHDNTASTARGGIDGNLRIGLILLLVGLLLGLINGLIGTIVAIIGLIFIILWLLDQL